MKLILHIGSHKTGTTSIQQFLSTNNSNLNALNWQFVESDKALNWGDLFRFKINNTPRVNIEFREESYSKLFAALSSNSFDKIISIEDLFFINHCSILEKFSTDLFGIFDQIHIVLFLRNQLQAAISNKAQAAKTYRHSIIFGNNPHSLLPDPTNCVTAYLRYSQKLSLWQKAFPKAKFSVVNYDKTANSISDFCRECELPLNVPQNMKENKSFDGNLTYLLHKLKNDGIPHRLIKEIYTNKVITNQGGSMGKVSQSCAKAFMSTYSSENAKLKEEFGIDLQCDFNEFPNHDVKPSLDEQYQISSLIKVIKYLSNH